MHVAQRLSLILAALACWLPGCAEEPPAPQPPAEDPGRGGVAVGGLVTAAIGESCAPCHEEQTRGYRTSGMHDSLTLPYGEGSPEAGVVGQRVTRESTGSTARLELEDGRYVQYLEYVDPTGVVRASHRTPIDLVIGSGHAGRSYLHVRDGAMFQLPLTWYSQLGGLGFSPGTTWRDIGMRFAPLGCIECHTGEVTPRSADEELGFRGEIGLGIGCARCHGDGDEHVETGDPRDIVNPARLDIERQSDVCYQCHLTTAQILRRRGRRLAAFRPGDVLAEILGTFDPVATPATTATPSGRAEGTSISGHSLRLRRSLCFERSEEMTCTTCHDPHEGHRTGDAAERASAGCTVCHDDESCATPAHERGARSCASCHMATVPASDIVHARVTDHYIQRRPAPRRRPAGEAGEETIAALARADVELVNLLDPDDGLPGSRVLKARAYLAGAEKAGAPAPGYLRRALALCDEVLSERADDAEAQVVRAQVLHRSGQHVEAREAMLRTVTAHPDHADALAQLAFSQMLVGETRQALVNLERAWELQPYAEHLPLALADVLMLLRRPAAAATALERATERLGPSLVRADRAAAAARAAGDDERTLAHTWTTLLFRPREPKLLTRAAVLAKRTGHPEETVRALLIHAVVQDGGYVPALLELGRLELSAGRIEEAREAARSAARAAPDSPEVRELLDRLR